PCGLAVKTVQTPRQLCGCGLKRRGAPAHHRPRLSLIRGGILCLHRLIAQPEVIAVLGLCGTAEERQGQDDTGNGASQVAHEMKTHQWHPVCTFYGWYDQFRSGPAWKVS